jgi:hypothetical protein
MVNPMALVLRTLGILGIGIENTLPPLFSLAALVTLSLLVVTLSLPKGMSLSGALRSIDTLRQAQGDDEQVLLQLCVLLSAGSG